MKKVFTIWSLTMIMVMCVGGNTILLTDLNKIVSNEDELRSAIDEHVKK